jgi:peptidoglycan hydrolase-like protein with peptidoglycan-binding domain
LVLLPIVVVGGCSEESPAERAQKAAEQIRRSIPDVDATAIAQNADTETIKQAQQRLRILNEYMGEINGELDGVTVHAIEAFQRSTGLPDNGILDERTLKQLRKAAPG